MSDTEFTPGPWFVVGYGRIIRSSESGYAGETICVFDANRSETLYANHEANAHLIAAVPEMYAALQASLRMIDELTAQASVCMSHVGVLPNQQNWVRNEIRAYAIHLRKPIDAALAKAVRP